MDNWYWLNGKLKLWIIQMCACVEGYPTLLVWLTWMTENFTSKFPFTCHGQTRQNKILFNFNFTMTPLSTTPLNSGKAYLWITRLFRFRIIFTPASRKISFFLYQKDSIHSPGPWVVWTATAPNQTLSQSLLSPTTGLLWQSRSMPFLKPLRWRLKGWKPLVYRFFWSITNVE